MSAHRPPKEPSVALAKKRNVKSLLGEWDRLQLH